MLSSCFVGIFANYKKVQFFEPGSFSVEKIDNLSIEVHHDNTKSTKIKQKPGKGNARPYGLSFDIIAGAAVLEAIFALFLKTVDRIPGKKQVSPGCASGGRAFIRSVSKPLRSFGNHVASGSQHLCLKIIIGSTQSTPQSVCKKIVCRGGPARNEILHNFYEQTQCNS